MFDRLHSGCFRPAPDGQVQRGEVAQHVQRGRVGVDVCPGGAPGAAGRAFEGPTTHSETHVQKALQHLIVLLRGKALLLRLDRLGAGAHGGGGEVRAGRSTYWHHLRLATGTCGARLRVHQGVHPERVPAPPLDGLAAAAVRGADLPRLPERRRGRPGRLPGHTHPDRPGHPQRHRHVAAGDPGAAAPRVALRRQALRNRRNCWGCRRAAGPDRKRR
mmetsp:Transcript_138603/g.431107  ORF Transcript_138603/g.431107 Transcript_138603/m.431107 type:complete len:217 (-) Transcript_138603:149-799(-)